MWSTRCDRSRRAPGLAAAVIATFALGIGANATMFGIIDRLLLRPPAHRPRAGGALPRRDAREVAGRGVHEHRDLVPRRTRTFATTLPASRASPCTTFPNPMSLGLGADARKITGVLVSGTYFGTLGVADDRRARDRAGR